jgi:hypothetical protein
MAGRKVQHSRLVAFLALLGLALLIVGVAVPITAFKDDPNTGQIFFVLFAAGGIFAVCAAVGTSIGWFNNWLGTPAAEYVRGDQPEGMVLEAVRIVRGSA